MYQSPQMALSTIGKDCFLNNDINYCDTQNLIHSFSPSVSEGLFSQQLLFLHISWKYDSRLLTLVVYNSYRFSSWAYPSGCVLFYFIAKGTSPAQRSQLTSKSEILRSVQKFIVTITSFCLYERYLSIFAVCLFNQTDYR